MRISPEFIVDSIMQIRGGGMATSADEPYRNNAVRYVQQGQSDSYAFALALAVLTWLADTSAADREIARATFAVFTLSRVWADRPACVPPNGSEIVENVSPVDLTQRAKARADLDAWMQAGIDGTKGGK